MNSISLNLFLKNRKKLCYFSIEDAIEDFINKTVGNHPNLNLAGLLNEYTKCKKMLIWVTVL